MLKEGATVLCKIFLFLIVVITGLVFAKDLCGWENL